MFVGFGRGTTSPIAVPVPRMLAGFVEEAPVATARRKQPWPDSLRDQVRAIKEILRGSPAQTAQQVTSRIRLARRTRVEEILTTPVALGQARATGQQFSL